MKARIRWFAIPFGSQERIPASRRLAGSWGWDATCSCGWDSKTGGGLRRSVERKVADHKLFAHDVESRGLFR